ncbi:hypothetical protein HELRODRAFT_164586 [Helobdella robusta]|uniref:Uncharacterized protein n=1 Tax=Helobdella robusta TaxID=6412 RepID=T1EVL7_HELRO|nr:hypothetical protein HELRODRAFT_164586 [Helobdella robusta]ESN94700.1 hypothetical protein HELRODRAFT_164586 [Helobdella robusta]
MQSLEKLKEWTKVTTNIRNSISGIYHCTDTSGRYDKSILVLDRLDRVATIPTQKPFQHRIHIGKREHPCVFVIARNKKCQWIKLTHIDYDNLLKNEFQLDESKFVADQPIGNVLEDMFYLYVRVSFGLGKALISVDYIEEIKVINKIVEPVINDRHEYEFDIGREMDGSD